MMSEEQDSQQSTRKPKRKSTAPVIPAKRRLTKSAKSVEGSDSGESAAEIDTSSWTAEFKQLEQVFRSLNTVYTFCCTRKHFPTTFENLRKSVENLSGRYVQVQN
jgi:DEAD/DEAH box helicase domain-containing protein